MNDNGTAVAESVPVNRISPPALRKVAIIGKAPSSVKLAPYDDPEWEMWVLNTLASMHEVPRWDRQFELHDIELTKDKAYGDYHDFLRKQSHGDRPVILRDTIPDDFGEAAIPFPLSQLRKVFADMPSLYITNTVSWMIALALLEHKQGQEIGEMGLWGVDMAQHNLGYGHAGAFASEYARQRPSVELWIGIAVGLGIKVHIPPTSDILKTACLYGYHTDEVWKKIQQRNQELEQRIGAAQQRSQQAHDEALYLQGARESSNHFAQLLPSPPGDG